MKRPIAHSYTSITSYETCPKRHYHLRVAKDVVEPPTDALKWGEVVHKALENRLRDGTELPEKLAHYESYAALIEEMPGEKLVEEAIALDKNFQRVDWWDKAAWLRAKLDVGVVANTKAAIFDWKTGKRKPDNDQLDLFAGVAFAVLPEVQQITTGFIWLPDKKIDKKVFTREQSTDIWQGFLARIARVERAHEQDKWPAKPSGLCRSYCPVGRSKCEFCGRE